MKEKTKVSIYEPGVLALGIILAIFSAAICMQIMGMFGTAPNTSLIVGVLIMIIARIPLQVLKKYSDLERQNYIMSIASAAGFSAANGAFIGIAMVFVMDRTDLVIPLSIGIASGSVISIFATYKLFNSSIFPTSGSWPMATAAATILKAGNEGGKKGKELFTGILIGAILNQFGLPATGIGIAFVANMVTMAAMGTGLIISGFSPYLFDFNVLETNIPAGLMIGAGIVASIQIVTSISKKKSTKPESAEKKQDISRVSESSAKKSLVFSFALFTVGAVILAIITGVFSKMSNFASLIWIVYASIATVITMLLVGTASMHSGIAPSFAVVTLFLTIGMFLNFPPIALAMMVGYIGSVGMIFADTGIGLKTGFLIRNGINEIHGRKQQTIIKMLGAIIGVLMAFLFGITIIEGDAIPPMSIFYANTVSKIVSPSVILELLIWVIPGAILQVVFGTKSVGLMVATGLLIGNGMFGIFILVSLLVRLKFGTKYMTIRAPGLIAGDGIWGFISILWRLF